MLSVQSTFGNCLEIVDRFTSSPCFCFHRAVQIRRSQPSEREISAPNGLPDTSTPSDNRKIKIPSTSSGAKKNDSRQTGVGGLQRKDPLRLNLCSISTSSRDHKQKGNFCQFLSSSSSFCCLCHFIVFVYLFSTLGIKVSGRGGAMV